MKDSKLTYIPVLSIWLLGVAACVREPKGLNAKENIHIRFPELHSNIQSYSAYLYSQNGKEYLAYSSLVSKKIQLINIETNTAEFSIPLNNIDSAFDFSFNKPKFFIHNLDSVFILPDESKNIFLLGRNGEIIDSWDLRMLDGPNFILSGFSSNPLLYSNGKIYVRYVPKINPFFQKSVYFKTKPELIINILSKNSGIDHAGGWPEKYSTQNYYDDYPFICLNTDEQLVYSYAADHDIYVYKGDSLVKRSVAKSDFIDQFKLFNSDSVGNIEYTMKYLTTAPQYANILYDKYRNLYYRVALHKTELVNKDGKTIKRLLDRPWSLIVLNKNFEKMYEKAFDPAVFAYGPMYVSKEGLMIPKRRSKTAQSDDVYDWDFVVFNVNL